ncbi:MAG: chemotaxis protein CheX [Deltaproteobacteria bacterium]|nr:chemotaxis protein CheX [Deltaproteobacteria bacterium]
MSVSVNVNFFKPFIDGTANTLKVQCSTEAKPMKPYFKGQSNEPERTFSIAAILGITSPSFTGTISVCYPKPVFLGLMNRMLGEKYTDLSRDLEDGAAELLNIIFGHAKRVLNAQGFTLHMAIPTVIRGENMTSRHVSETPTIVLPFSSDLGEFFLEICTYPQQPQGPVAEEKK